MPQMLVTLNKVAYDTFYKKNASKNGFYKCLKRKKSQLINI